MNKLKKLLFISSALLLSTANNTFAAAAGTITASGTVVGTCTVTASNMAFGTLSQIGTTLAYSTVTPNCTNGTPWTVTNSGANEGYIYLGSNAALVSTSRLAAPITVNTGFAASGQDFTLANAVAGKLVGTGTGSDDAQTNALKGTAANANGNVAGVYGGTITLTITY
jgi:spore coat protein U-like protein